MNTEKFVSYIVNKYYHVGVKHVLVIAFLSEYEYYSEYNERITNTEYKYIMNIRNDTIETILRDNYDVTTKTINGEEVDIINSQQDVSIPSNVAYVVNEVVANHVGCTYSEYCKSVENKIPQEMRIGRTSISFDELCD